jgi:hypothetical protein
MRLTFFPNRYQDEARTVAERYIPKTNPHILLISTPNLPGGLFERMEDEIDNGYVMKQMDYTIGLNKVFRPEDIETAKNHHHLNESTISSMDLV